MSDDKERQNAEKIKTFGQGFIRYMNAIDDSFGKYFDKV